MAGRFPPLSSQDGFAGRLLYAYGEPISKSGWEQRMLVSHFNSMDTMPMDKKRMRVCSLVPAQGWTTPPSCGTVGR